MLIEILKDILIKSKDGECKEKKVERKLNPWFWEMLFATSLVSNNNRCCNWCYVEI